LKKKKENKKNPNNLFHSDSVFQKATLAQTRDENRLRLKIPRVNHWKKALKQRLVQKNKRKPCLQGMSKSQIQMIRKRSKFKKLSKRRK